MEIDVPDFERDELAATSERFARDAEERPLPIGAKAFP
jgi:hypothetical protein